MPPIRTPQERIGRTLGRLVAGTLGGTLDTAAKPVTPVGELRSIQQGHADEVAFHWRGPAVVDESEEWPVPTDIVLVRFRVRLTVAGTSTTTVVLYADGVSAASVSFGSGVGGTLYDTAPTVTFVAAGDALTVGTTAAGAGAEGIVAVAEYE